MAVAFQASSDITGASSGDVTVVLPAHQAGDILVVCCLHKDISDTIATPSGWTLMFDANNASNRRLIGFWLRATSSSETDPLIDATTGTANLAGFGVCYRGAKASGDPFEAVSTPSFGTIAGATNTGVTSLTAGALIGALTMAGDNLAVSCAFTATDPASLTNNEFDTDPAGTDFTAAEGSAVRASAGASGTVTATYDTAPGGWGLVVFSLAAAAAAGGSVGCLTQGGLVHPRLVRGRLVA